MAYWWSVCLLDLQTNGHTCKYYLGKDEQGEWLEMSA